MVPIKLLLAPIRRIIRFPLFQLAVTMGAILWLEAATDNSILGQIYNMLDKVVDFSVQRCAAIFQVKSFTRSWLTAGFWIAYVYLIGLVILYFAKLVTMAIIELVARHNILYLRNAIARERGVEAYRAWLPLENIRPAHIPQEKWEEKFAWPADNRPPYPSLVHRVARVFIFYVALLLIVAILLQEFTPFAAITWLGNAARRLATGG